MKGESQNPWDSVKAQLQKKVSARCYENWFAQTKFAGVAGKALLVTAPNEATVRFLLEEYKDMLNAMAKAEAPGIDRVELSAETAIPADRVSAYGNETRDSRGNESRATETDFESPIALNPKFTFDSFVVGSCNQFAHAAAQSVALNPSRSYNPLFLYGGSGMGKTHLMHAIGRALQSAGRLRIIYTTSERFTNEVVTGIKHERMAQLRARYRSADVLLIDDIQSLGSKERTQEEFFHTFNDLHEAQKQIVISSDCPPKEILGLVERLRSRFEWGLTADIQPPDLETKMAILQKKAEQQGFEVPADVCAFISNKTKNVRELEGALLKVHAYSSITSVPISVPMAQQVLKDLLARQDRRITIESIQKAVAEKFGLKPSQIKEKSNRKEVVYPRQIAMYLAKELTKASLPEIGRAFGGKHHTTVIHSVQKIEALRASEPDTNKVINNLMDSFN